MDNKERLDLPTMPSVSGQCSLDRDAGTSLAPSGSTADLQCPPGFAESRIGMGISLGGCRFTEQNTMTGNLNLATDVGTQPVPPKGQGCLP